MALSQTLGECVAAEPAGPATIGVRPATPADIPILMDMKLELARATHSECVVVATAADWLRDGFGQQARFSAFIAEDCGVPRGMVIYNERYITGWVGPTLAVQDLYVDPAHRKRGIGRMLLAQVAAHACAIKSPVVELTVRIENPARAFYDRIGFLHVRECLTYVVFGQTLNALAESADDILTLSG